MTHDSWNDYWRLGALTTLNAFREGYTGEFAEFWHRLVDRLPDGARALDLATGNGAVAVALQRRARALGRTLAVEGVDAADIDPVAHAGHTPQLRAELRAIRFHPNTPAERTGLPTAHYDLVASQYGIEYGDLSAAIVEIARLLKPGGWFGAVVHSADSNIARTAARIETLMTTLLDELALVARLRALLPRVGDTADTAAPTRSRQDPATHAAWSEFEQSVAQARATAAREREMALTTEGFLQRLLVPLQQAGAMKPAEQIAWVAQVEREARGLEQRMRALRRSALDPTTFGRFLDELRRAGLATESSGTLHFGPQRENMGYAIVARRGGDGG